VRSSRFKSILTMSNPRSQHVAVHERGVRPSLPSMSEATSSRSKSIFTESLCPFPGGPQKGCSTTFIHSVWGYIIPFKKRLHNAPTPIPSCPREMCSTVSILSVGGYILVERASWRRPHTHFRLPARELFDHLYSQYWELHPPALKHFRDGPMYFPTHKIVV